MTSPELPLLRCLLTDEGASLAKALDAGLSAADFEAPLHQTVFSALREMHAEGTPIGADTLYLKLGSRITSQELLDVTGEATTAHFSHHLKMVLRASRTRAKVQEARRLIEAAERGEDISGTDIPELSLAGRPLGSFVLPESESDSILIGNRWLCRGDIFILASTSGMGKSSLAIQAAVTWGLGRKLFDGFDPHRPLKSLMFQAEDGDGDIAEVRLSMEHAMSLTSEQRKQVDANVLIVTDRIHRGLSFRAELKRQLAIHQPDLVWINPLLAFLGGDVNDSTDVGTFLREQLNSLNEPPRFAYGIIHHTAKPPKEKRDRQWNEVMYEMAGSADLTNAARAILSLQATGTEGTFKLIAAKRGPRAGLTEMVPGTINSAIKFPAPTSTVMVRHAKERFTPPGSKTEIPLIHWERLEETPDDFAKKAGGRPPKYDLPDLAKWIPSTAETAKPHQQIYRDAEASVVFSKVAAKGILIRATSDGRVKVIDRPGCGPCYYLPKQ